jgi:hypothetical protein
LGLFFGNLFLIRGDETNERAYIYLYIWGRNERKGIYIFIYLLPFIIQKKLLLIKKSKTTSPGSVAHKLQKREVRLLKKARQQAQVV